MFIESHGKSWKVIESGRSYHNTRCVNNWLREEFELWVGGGVWSPGLISILILHNFFWLCCGFAAQSLLTLTPFAISLLGDIKHKTFFLFCFPSVDTAQSAQAQAVSTRVIAGGRVSLTVHMDHIFKSSHEGLCQDIPDSFLLFKMPPDTSTLLLSFVLLGKMALN